MNKEEQKRLMSWIRPAIIALYGRQKLKMTGYNILGYDKINFYEKYVKCGWFTIKGDSEYKIKVENGCQVTYVEKIN